MSSGRVTHGIPSAIRLVRDFCPSLILKGQACLSRVSATQQYPAGIQVFQQGGRPENVYIVNSGIIKLASLGLSGCEAIVNLQGTGSILGAAAAILNRSHETSGTTLTECELQRVLSTDLIELMRSNLEISWLIQEIQAQDIFAQRERLVGLATQSAKQRLANLLLECISKTYPESCMREYAFNIPLKQWEIAQLLGITPEHVNRLLRRFEAQGLIRRRKSTIVISNPTKLVEQNGCV